MQNGSVNWKFTKFEGFLRTWHTGCVAMQSFRKLKIFDFLCIMTQGAHTDNIVNADNIASWCRFGVHTTLRCNVATSLKNAINASGVSTPLLVMSVSNWAGPTCTCLWKYVNVKVNDFWLRGRGTSPTGVTGRCDQALAFFQTGKRYQSKSFWCKVCWSILQQTSLHDPDLSHGSAERHFLFICQNQERNQNNLAFLHLSSPWQNTRHWTKPFLSFFQTKERVKIFGKFWTRTVDFLHSLSGNQNDGDWFIYSNQTAVGTTAQAQMLLTERGALLECKKWAVKIYTKDNSCCR